MSDQYVNPHGGEPVNAQAAIKHPDGWIPGEREQVEWTEGSGRARQLVDAAGNPLSAQDAIDVKRALTVRNRRRRARAAYSEAVGTGHASAPSRIIPARARRERDGIGFITYGVLFWLFFVVVSIANGLSAGTIIVLILAAPLLIPLMGIVAKAFFGMLGIAMRS